MSPTAQRRSPRRSCALARSPDERAASARPAGSLVEAAYGWDTRPPRSTRCTRPGARCRAGGVVTARQPGADGQGRGARRSRRSSTRYRGQTRRPDEVVVVDGGSRDGTPEMLRSAAERFRGSASISPPGSTIAGGRNAAIARAGPGRRRDRRRHRPPSATGSSGSSRRSRDGRADVAIEVFEPAAVVARAEIAATITPHVGRSIRRRSCRRAARVAFRKERGRRRAATPSGSATARTSSSTGAAPHRRDVRASSPTRLVGLARPAGTPRFARQYFDYARGDGHADLWRGATRSLRVYRSARAPAGPAATHPYGGGSRRRLRRHVGKYVRRVLRHRPFSTARERCRRRRSIPLVVVIGDVAKMAGYPVGTWERLTRGVRHPDTAYSGTRPASDQVPGTHRTIRGHVR